MIFPSIWSNGIGRFKCTAPSGPGWHYFNSLCVLMYMAEMRIKLYLTSLDLTKLDLPRWMGHLAIWQYRCLGIRIACITCLSLSGSPASRLMLGGVRFRLNRHQYSGSARVDVNLFRHHLFTAWSLITRAANTGVWATAWAAVLTQRLAIRYKDKR